jgi:hypothetical protein
MLHFQASDNFFSALSQGRNLSGFSNFSGEGIRIYEVRAGATMGRRRPSQFFWD